VTSIPNVSTRISLSRNPELMRINKEIIMIRKIPCEKETIAENIIGLFEST